MITATVSVDDYINAHQLHARSAMKKWFLVSALTAVVGAVLMSLRVQFWGWVLLGGGLGSLLGTWWDVRARIPAKVRKLYGQYKDIAEPTQITWDGEYLKGRNVNGESRRKWRDYVRLKEDDKVFLLYVTDQIWQVIPKRCFAGEAEIDEFRKHASLAST